MKLCLVYSLEDNKLHPKAYTSIFKNMFNALHMRFEKVQLINHNCSTQDIDADLIFFFDPHASHHIEIDGIEKHRALKMELWNDVHQEEMKGHFKTTDLPVHKLGQEQRATRSKERGIDYIIVATKYLFFELFEHRFENIEKMTLYHPHAPIFPPNVPLLGARKKAVLGNGSYHPNSWRGSYDFRGWAFQQPYIEFVPHALLGKGTPQADEFIKFMSGYAGAFTGALCPVPKYSEIPAAGCVPFLQYQREWEEIGFKDHEACIYVRKVNLEKEVKAFLADPGSYQGIADKGREIIKGYSDKKFADFVYRKVEEHTAKSIKSVSKPVEVSARPQNVFILNAGRCGSTTFIEACKHITNYTAGHETRSGNIGIDRLAYPKGHIEADNRLSWFLGRLDRQYGDNAIYVHLKRDNGDTSLSFAKRFSAGIMGAYKSAILMGNQSKDQLSICYDYLDTVTANIEAFLKDKSHKMVFNLENAKEDFKKFWDLIGAEGDFNSAIKEFDIAHNASVG